MARVLILRRQALTPRLDEEIDRLLKDRPGPERATCYEYVDVYSETELVRTLARWSGPGTPVQKDLVQLLLRGTVTRTTVVVELDADLRLSAAE